MLTNTRIVVCAFPGTTNCEHPKFSSTMLELPMIQAPTATRPNTATPNTCIRPVTIFTIPVDRETIFSNHKGLYKSAIEKRQRRLIVKSTFIRPFLQVGEYVRCMTTGHSPVSTIEQDLIGPAFLYFKRALLIFTDRRILHIPTRFNRTPRGAMSQIMYADCVGLDIKGNSLEIRYKKGRREFFHHLGRTEKKKIRVLLSEVASLTTENGQHQERVCLCPKCTSILAEGAKRCASCRLTFKNKLKTGLWAFLVPGGGMFYLRYPLAGTSMASIEIAVIAFAVFTWLAVDNQSRVDFGMIALATCGVIAAKLLSFFYARQLVQEFVPEDKDFSYTNAHGKPQMP